MAESKHNVADIAEKIAARPAPASGWAPITIADLIKRVDHMLHVRQLI